MAAAARIAAALILLVWARAVRRPVDSLAVLAAAAASLLIIVNALVLQSGSAPAPFLVDAPPSLPAAAAAPPGLPLPLARPAAAAPAPQPVGALRNDPIAQLIDNSSHILAVQRALSDYGYGQIKLTGFLDRPTTSAIEKFEREHNLPVTGRVSERLLTDLAAMIGHPLQ